MMPPFTDPSAVALWVAYFSQVEKLVRLAGLEGGDLKSDLEMHLRDSYAAQPVESSEVNRVQVAIRRMGEPEDYLRPLIADGLIRRGTRRLDPAALIRGLYYATRLGNLKIIVGILFGAGFVISWSVFVLGLLWPFWHGHIGLFRWPDGATAFGFTEKTIGATNVLGRGTMPVMLGAAALAHVLATWGLRRVWRKA